MCSKKVRRPQEYRVNIGWKWVNSWNIISYLIGEKKTGEKWLILDVSD